MTDEIFKKLQHTSNIIFSIITFLLTILTLAQFIYVRNLYYFIISFLVHLGIIFIMNSIYYYIDKTRGYVVFKKNEFKVIWLIIYFARVISCCVILAMIHIGNLFRMEEVALAGDPFSITYTVFVFMLLFLEFFSIYLRIAEKTE